MPHWSLLRPAIPIRIMVTLAGELGVSASRCVAGTGLEMAELANPRAEVRGEQELQVLRNILHAVPPSVPFALRAGLRFHPTTHGMWGFALLSSPDARSAIEVGLRYFDLSFSLNRVSFEVVGDEARLVYDASDNPDDLQQPLVERDLAALVTFERDIHGMPFPRRSLHLRSRRPAYAEAFTEIFGVEPVFDAEANYLTFDAALLDLRQPQGDDFGLRVSEEQCQRLIERRGERSGVAGRVRSQILQRPGEFPPMKVVAARLEMSTRTLHSKLAREGTSFRELMEEIRETLAEQLLAGSRLTVDEIAQRLGYSDTSSFVAAFKRWKGLPPRSFIRAVRSDQDRKPR